MLASGATLITGVSLARMSARAPQQSGLFTAGTVSVGLDGAGTQVTCSVNPINPGDSSAGAPIDNQTDPTCKFQVQYTGSVSAWLAVDVSVTNGSTVLYDGTNQGLQLYLTDGTRTYLTSTATDIGGAGTTYSAQNTGTATTLPPAGITNLLVSAATAASAPNVTVQFSLDYALPADSLTTYQNGSAIVKLTFHAVQAGHVSLPSGANSCSSGQRCNTSMSWS